MRLAAFTCAFLLAMAVSAPIASAACQQCPEGQVHSHETGTCVPKSVSS